MSSWSLGAEMLAILVLEELSVLEANWLKVDPVVVEGKLFFFEEDLAVNRLARALSSYK